MDLKSSVWFTLGSEDETKFVTLETFFSLTAGQGFENTVRMVTTAKVTEAKLREKKTIHILTTATADLHAWRSHLNNMTSYFRNFFR